jgi:hypothetical protein
MVEELNFHSALPYKKTLQPVPMGTRVNIPPNYLGKPAKGTVAGIAQIHVVFQYIIILDEPYIDPSYGEMRAITVSGPELEGEDGTNWRGYNI